MTKRSRIVLSITFMIAIVITLVTNSIITFAQDISTPTYSWYGDGSAASFNINSVSDFIGFRNIVNGADGKTAFDFSGKTVNLTTDIVLNANAESYESWATTAPANTWIPIGGEQKIFEGTFDGNNHTVSGIYINSTNTFQGLFGISKGTIKNIGIINSYIKGGDYVGGITSGNLGNITNCYNTGIVSGLNVGGIVGYNNSGIIENCYNTGTVNGGYVGGIVSDNNNGNIKNCYNTGSIEGNKMAGGISSYHLRNSDDVGTITNCYNTGVVTGAGYYVGDIVAYIGSSNKTNITNTYYSGCNAGVGGASAPQDGTTPFLSLANNNINIGSSTSINEVIPTWSTANALGTGFAVNYNNYQSDFVNITGKTITSTKAGTGNITATMTITQNALTSTGFDGAIKTIQVPISIPVYVPNPMNSPTYAWYGDGTATNLNINSTSDFIGFKNIVNGTDGKAANNFSNKTVNLNVDIVLNANAESYENWGTTAPENVWTPIGVDGNHYFSGTFNGNNHTVSGVYIDKKAAYDVGLFGHSNGTIKNLGLINSYIICNFRAGGILADNSGTITNCYNASIVSVIDDTVGGVIATNSGTITNCYNTGKVNGKTYVGGVIGSNGMQYTNNVMAANCYNAGTVSGTSNVGGIVGNVFFYSTLTNGYNIGTVTGTNNVGGVTGANDGTITNTYYYGNSVGVGGDNALQTGTTKLGATIGISSINLGSSTSINEVIPTWSTANALGAGFTVTYKNYESTIASITGTTVTGTKIGTGNVTAIMTTTQNELTSTGFDGATKTIQIPFSMPLTVNAVNNAPTVKTAVPTKTITVGISSIISAVEIADDVDAGDTLKITDIKTAPNSSVATAVLNNSTVTIIGISSGNTSVEVTVSDSQNAIVNVTVPIKVTVTNLNNAPTSKTTVPTVTITGIGISSIKASDIAEDEDGDALEIIAIKSNSNSNVAAAVLDGKIVKVTSKIAGSTTIVITVSDGNGATLDVAVPVAVVMNSTPDNDNNSPTVKTPISVVSIVGVGMSSFNASVIADDLDGDTLTITAIKTLPNPSIATATLNNGTVTVNGVSSGITSIVVTVSDNNGSIIDISLPITITGTSSSNNDSDDSGSGSSDSSNTPVTSTNDKYVQQTDITNTNGTVSINISAGSTVLSTAQMTSLVELNKTEPIIINNSNYSITFAQNTMKLVDGQTDYDFSATINSGNNFSAIKELSGDNFVMMISYNHSGKLPAEATIKIKVDTEYIGKTLNYYYYNLNTGKPELIQSAIVDENGYITVKQSHFSDYIITDKMLGNNINKNNPKTGIENVSNPIIVGLTVLIIVALAALVTVTGLKRTNSKLKTQIIATLVLLLML